MLLKTYTLNARLDALLKLSPGCSMPQPPFFLGPPALCALYEIIWVIWDSSPTFLIDIGGGLHSAWFKKSVISEIRRHFFHRYRVRASRALTREFAQSTLWIVCCDSALKLKQRDCFLAVSAAIAGDRSFWAQGAYEWIRGFSAAAAE